MLEAGTQNAFEIWNYGLTFSSVAVLAVFVIDMIGHNTKTLTASAFSWASLTGILVGEICLTLFELYSLPAAIPVAFIASIVSSMLVALMLQTKDPEVEKRRFNQSRN